MTLDVNSFKIKSLGRITPDIATSLDHTTIATDLNSNTLGIISATQDLLFPFPHDTYLDLNNAFLTGGLFMLRDRRAIHQTYQFNKGASDKYYVLSPDTGHVTSASLFLPDYWDFLGQSSSFIAYSPDLKFVLYPAEGHFNLYDIDNKTIVWSGWAGQLPSVVSSFSHAVWKPDASAVTIIDHAEELKKAFTVV